MRCAMSIEVKNIILRDETPFELDNEVILKNFISFHWNYRSDGSGFL